MVVDIFRKFSKSLFSFEQLFLFFFLITSLFSSIQAFQVFLGGVLWNRIDGSATGLQLELEHQFEGKYKNSFLDMAFRFPLVFRFQKNRPFFLPGIELFPNKTEVNRLDDIRHPMYLSYYIKHLHYRYKNFHLALEPSQEHFLHHGLLLRGNPFNDISFSGYTPALAIYYHQEFKKSGLYTSELGQTGMYLFYGHYQPLANNKWYLAKEFKISPILWSDFTRHYTLYKEIGLGMELSTVVLKKNKFSLGLFSAFDFYSHPNQKTYAYYFSTGIDFQSVSYHFAMATQVRSQSHFSTAVLSSLYPIQRQFTLDKKNYAIPGLIFFLHPKESIHQGVRFSSEFYFIEPLFSYHLEYFFKNKNFTVSFGHGREGIQKFLDLKNFKSSPSYFSVSFEGKILNFLKINWQTRYYYWQKADLTSYAAAVFSLMPKKSEKPFYPSEIENKEDDIKTF